MKKVFLRYYDERNLGDDLFAKIITDRYKDSFFVVSNRSEFLENKTNVKVFNNTFLIKVSRAFEKLLRMPNFIKQYYIFRSDIYVYIGGSIFIDSGNHKHWDSEVNFFKKIIRPYYIIGANYGPEQSIDFRNKIRRILINASDVSFRDSASYETFSDINSVRYASDVVFSLNTDKIPRVNEKKIAISVIDCSSRFGEEVARKYETSIVSLTEKYCAKGYTVVYMSFCESEGDSNAIDRIKASLSKEAISNSKHYRYSNDLEVALSIIASSEYVIGTRFHSIILGLIFDKKVLPIAYSKKTKNYLSDAGFEGAVVELHKIDDVSFGDYSLEKIKHFDKSKQVMMSNEQFKVLDDILTRGEGYV